jgi:predicted small lipoprotein YifL
MLNASRILVVAAAGALCACGQKGDLYLPTEPAAANRATLTDTLQPWAGPAAPAASAPVPASSSGTGTANPVRTP